MRTKCEAGPSNGKSSPLIIDEHPPGEATRDAITVDAVAAEARAFLRPLPSAAIASSICSPIQDLERRSDHSPVRFLELLTRVNESNISDWRRRTVGDLSTAFRFDEHQDAPALPDAMGAYNLAQYEMSQLPLPTVPARQQLPRQERGYRRK